MNRLKRILVRAIGGLGSLLVVAVSVLWLWPPELVRIGANYTAKIVCSNVFLAGRDPRQVLSIDVQSVGHPLLRLMRVSVDRERGTVRAGLFGFVGDGLAQARPGAGCTVLPDGRVDAGIGRPIGEQAAARPPRSAGSAGALWPDGDAVQTTTSVDRLLNDDTLAGPGMRALLVVHHGRIVGERYADGFDADTPQLGWSMTKSVTAGLIGLLIKDGKLSLEQSAGWPAADPRAAVRVADLLGMSSGLRFNESYGAVSDVTRMLYLEPDMAAFAQGQPLDHAPGSFWSYSSGTAVMLARMVQDAAGADAVGFARRRLFGPLGMVSAVMESDEHGTWVGSSYMYATPRDWARYGWLLASDGVWRGRAILPPGYVAMMSSPSAASGGEYGRGLVWRWLNHREASGVNGDAEFALPDDVFWLVGHDGQYVAVVPSQELVLVRLGLTPSRLGYGPQALLRATLADLR